MTNRMLSRLRNALAGFGALWLVVGCGGGGDAGPASPPAAVAPAITAQPASTAVAEGQVAMFGVTASGTAPLAYQWRKNGSDIAGAIGAAYTTPATTLADNGASYSVAVSNGAGQALSNSATLTVNAVAPAIVMQPASTSVAAGQTATFTITATGTAPLTYQWRRGAVDIAGATNASYTTPATATGDNGAVFSVVVTNAAGALTSNNATLTVTVAVIAPAITAQPASTSVTAGQTASFSVAATGTAPLAYQWKRGGVDIAGATSSSYTTPATSAADNGAQFSVVVSNGAGSAPSNAATLTVTPIAVAGRYVEAWASADANATSGSYQLSVVDPAAPATLIAVDQLPASVTSANAVQRVRGGTYDAATGTISDAGTRHLVYVKGGALYKVSLDKGGVVPAPVRMSVEAQADPVSLQILAQSSSGDEALFVYSKVGTTDRRFVRLSTPPTGGSQLAPTFPGDLFATGFLTASINDPATGAITGYLWPSLLANGQTRLYRTDADFGNPVSIATYTSVDLNLRLGLGALTGAKMRGGYFFIADGSLRRYDFASGNIRDVYPGVTSKIMGAVFDDTAIYVPLQTGAGPQFVAAPDTATSTGVSLIDGAPVGSAGLVPIQTKDYLILITGSTGDTAISVRKSDGLKTSLPAAGGIGFSWLTGGLATFEGYSAGNRVFYATINPGNIIGSVHADGTDRKEISGLATDVGALPSVVAAHRLLSMELAGLPIERLMIVSGQTRKWLNMATGDVGVTLGSLPSKLFPGFGCPKLPYRGCPIGRAAVLGYAENVQIAPGNSVPKLDAYFVNDQASSILRLTNNIP